jgi:hypothetical protein
MLRLNSMTLLNGSCAQCGARSRVFRLTSMSISRVVTRSAQYAAVALSFACASAPEPEALGPVRVPRVEFVPENERFASAVGEYERIWAADAARIARTMQEVSGLTFTDTAITAIVYEGVSSSGYRDTPMRLRASYPLDTKKATLMHELGHRLQSRLFRRQDEDHGPLFLWLYDSWARLYGKDFADAQVAVEKRRGGPYPRAWDEALALSPKERAERWRAIVENQRRLRR